jgi:hypothetical protein|tara:strand:+ start:281 stop:637 length:357 start_codon:yes stop_codon:yes gene_type:complete
MTGFSQMPNGLILKEISVGTFTMGSNTLMGSPAQQSAAPEHQVTLFDLGYIAIKTEIITIVESLLPNYSVRMNLKTYRLILHKLSKNKYLASVSDLFTKQMVCEELVEKAFKEYVYYT